MIILIEIARILGVSSRCPGSPLRARTAPAKLPSDKVNQALLRREDNEEEGAERR
jgi:hypothetical protein